ncbi:MAG TPA: ATP-binding protein [Anaerolineae bacterium]
MKHLSLPRIRGMSIRTRLLVLSLLFGAAVLVNMLALVNLARSVSASLANIESAHERQLLALTMYQELSNAEAALYRYQLENSTGFAAQFDFEINNFGRNAQAYHALATTTDEHSWANELAQIDEDSQVQGNQLIRLHDEQAANLRTLLATQTQLSTFLSGPVLSSLDDADPKHPVEGVQSSAQAMMLAIITHLATPDQLSHDQFDQAANRLQENLDRLQPLAVTRAELDQVNRMGESARQVQTLGAQLMDNRDQQQLLFIRFSAGIFEARQLVIFEQIQPLEEQRLIQAQRNLQTEITSAILISLGVPIVLSLIAVYLAIRLTRTLNQNILALLRGADRVAEGNVKQPVQVGTNDELKRLAQAFNNMMIDLAARERGLQARLAELETLHKVSLQITSTLDLDQVLNTVVSSALVLVNASSVQIFTNDENDGTLQLAASAGRSMDIQSPSSLIAGAANTGRLQVVHAETDAHAHSTAALPMRLGDQVLGVLHIASDPQQTLSSEDLRILRLLTDQATVALGNARLYRNLAEREERVRTLMEEMAHLQDEERRLIGLDLHDGLTQLIISANMHLNALDSTLAAPLDVQARQELEASRALIKEAIEEARRVIAELRPTVIEDLGLAEGLRRYVLEAGEANHWQSETHLDLDGTELSAPAQAAIFRIAQEALSNARKHSKTHKIRVVLQVDQTELLLCVQDWGSGFDPNAPSDKEGRLGLASMQERARMLGGTCEISSEPGHGTSVVVRVPRAALKRSST